MIKFSVNQIKFLSSTAIVLLSSQSLALANPSLHKKLTFKKQPQSIAQSFPPNQDVLFPNPGLKLMANQWKILNLHLRLFCPEP